MGNDKATQHKEECDPDMEFRKQSKAIIIAIGTSRKRIEMVEVDHQHGNATDAGQCREIGGS